MICVSCIFSESSYPRFSQVYLLEDKSSLQPNRANFCWVGTNNISFFFSLCVASPLLFSVFTVNFRLSLNSLKTWNPPRFLVLSPYLSWPISYTWVDQYRLLGKAFSLWQWRKPCWSVFSLSSAYSLWVSFAHPSSSPDFYKRWSTPGFSSGPFLCLIQSQWLLNTI